MYSKMTQFFTYIFIHVPLDLFRFFFANASGIFKLHFKGGGGEADGFRMLLIRSAKPRCFGQAVHNSVHALMRI